LPEGRHSEVRRRYRIHLQARSSREALDIYGREHRHIDTLIADERMNSTAGVALATSLRARDPALQVILTSGQPDWPLGGMPVPEGAILLGKPLQLATLLFQLARPRPSC
jgi:DNA-binding NtrC family response regulator